MAKTPMDGVPFVNMGDPDGGRRTDMARAVAVAPNGNSMIVESGTVQSAVITTIKTADGERSGSIRSFGNGVVEARYTVSSKNGATTTLFSVDPELARQLDAVIYDARAQGGVLENAEMLEIGELASQLFRTATPKDYSPRGK